MSDNNYDNKALIIYLNENYPKNGNMWLMIRIIFYNDYNRIILENLLAELNEHNKSAHAHLFVNILQGNLAQTSSYWIKKIDKGMFKLWNNIRDYIYIIKYFEVDDVMRSADKFSDLVHGEGYIENIRNLIHGKGNYNGDDETFIIDDL